MRNTQDLAQMTLNDYLKPGDLAIDANIKAGDITRFLSARVGDDGHVIAFSQDKVAIDSAAMSLFLSGLNARVEFIHKAPEAIGDYLDPTEPVGVAMIQLDDSINTTNLMQAIPNLLNHLKKNGLIIVLTEHVANLADVITYVKKLPTDSYDVQSYHDILTDEATLIVQRR